MTAHLKGLLFQLSISLIAFHSAESQVVVPATSIRTPPKLAPAQFERPSLSRAEQFQCQLVGQIGDSLQIEQSTDLKRWSLVTNIMVSGSGIPIALPMHSPGSAFLRARQADHPVNDQFAGRMVVRGAPVQLFGCSRGATREMTEPAVADVEKIQRTVWYEWMAPRTGLAVLKTVKGVPPYLSVFSRSGLAPFKIVAAGNEKVGFQVWEGLAYYISAGRMESLKLGLEGHFQLDLSLYQAPDNDSFANRRVLSGPLPIAVTGHNVGATLETNEVAALKQDHSVWFEWKAPQSGYYKISVLSNVFSTVSIFQENSLRELRLTAASDDWEAPFQAAGGMSYMIKVGALFSYADTFHLQIASVKPPVNDRFASSIPLKENAFSLKASFQGATPEPGLRDLPLAEARLWWTWTAPLSGWLSLTPKGASLQSGVEVFTGNTSSELTLLNSVKHMAGNSSRFLVKGGVKYHISAKKTFPGQDDSFDCDGQVTADFIDSYEPDNFRAQASEIHNGESQSRSLYEAGDHDWAKLVLAHSVTDLRIRVTSSSPTTRIGLYGGPDGQTDLFQKIHDGSSDVLQLSIPSLQAGAYYILVSELGDDNPVVSYSLQVNWLLLDDSETNEPLTNGAIQYRSLNPVGDKDVIDLFLDHTALNVTIQTAGQEGGTSIYIYGLNLGFSLPDDSSWTPNTPSGPSWPYTSVENVTYTNVNGFERLTCPALPSGSYLIEVSGGSQITPAYSIQASWQAEVVDEN